MEERARSDLTLDLEAACRGDSGARSRFWQHGYPDLHRLAAVQLAQWRGRVSMSPTEVLHEAFVRMVDRSRVTAEGAGYFYTSFATECRRLLVDHYRKKRAQARGGGRQRVTLPTEIFDSEGPEFDLVDLNDAIEELAKLDAREALIVDLRVFGGLTVEECAKALGVSKRTVEGDWTNARSWLRRQLHR